VALAPGTRLGGYEILALIGAGGMGEVYRATDSRLKRTTAIKVLPASIAGLPNGLERFEREAQTIASLNHPNIVTLYGVEQGPAGPFIVMEFVEGQPLGDSLPKGGLPLRRLLSIARQIADAVVAAHERGTSFANDCRGRVKWLANGRKIEDAPLARVSNIRSGPRAQHTKADSGEVFPSRDTYTWVVRG
jgi:serine/threonine protein kinase